MKSKLSVLLLSLLPSFLYGQVEGKIVSEPEKEAVAFVTVSAFDKNGNFLCGARSSDNGFFCLDAKDGISKIIFQAVGFEKKDTVSEKYSKATLGW